MIPPATDDEDRAHRCQTTPPFLSYPPCTPLKEKKEKKENGDPVDDDFAVNAGGERTYGGFGGWRGRFYLFYLFLYCTEYLSKIETGG
jgi:hypothetical protein